MNKQNLTVRPIAPLCTSTMFHKRHFNFLQKLCKLDYLKIIGHGMRDDGSTFFLLQRPTACLGALGIFQIRFMKAEFVVQ